MAAPTSISGLDGDDVLGNVLDIGGKVLTSLEPQLTKAGEKLATEIIRKVIIESEVSPPIVIDLQQKPTDPSQPPRTDWVGKLVKPRVTLDTTLGPMVIEPVGPPGPTKWPYIKWGAIGVGAVALFLMVRGIVK